MIWLALVAVIVICAIFGIAGGLWVRKAEDRGESWLYILGGTAIFVGGGTALSMCVFSLLGM